MVLSARKIEGAITPRTIDENSCKGWVFASDNSDVIVGDVVWAPIRTEYSSDADYLNFYVCRAGHGSFKFRSDLQNLHGTMAPGDLNVFLPGSTRSFEIPKVRLTFVLVRRPIVESIWQDFATVDLRSYLSSFRGFRDPLLEALITSTAKHARNSSLSLSFLEHALPLMVSQLATANDCDERTAALSDRQIRSISQYIHQHLPEEINLATLAGLSRLSIGEFSRRFRSATGRSPYAFVTELRMREAMSLMEDPARTISEVGASVGYSNPSQFANAFQKHTGFTPAKWRAREI